jgi:hypothetical protein
MDYHYGGNVFDAHLPLPPTKRELAKQVPDCGTDAGYQAHRRFDEDPCAPCSDARKTARKARDAAKKAAQAYPEGE